MGSRKAGGNQALGDMLLVVLGVCMTAFSCAPAPPPLAERPRGCSEFVVTGATLISAPDAPAQPGVSIVMRDGVIAEIRGEAPSTSMCVMDVAGRIVTAGFWNTHVHFTHPHMGDDQAAAQLMQEMFLRYGYTSVLDTGADDRVLMRVRAAIDAEQLVGPRVVSAGGSFVYRDGTPSYLPQASLQEIHHPEAAPPAVNRALDGGADGIKIFTGSYQGPEQTVHLPLPIVRAITEAAHARDAFVVAHPTDEQGVALAIDGGVDILAHTAPAAGPWSPALVTRMKAAQLALTPTLALWRWDLRRAGAAPEEIERKTQVAVEQLRVFHAQGGTVLFGTDVGYMTDYDPSPEYQLMQQAGLDFRAVLRSLTEAPAARFLGAHGGTQASGTVSVGARADLVVLDGDPEQDITALARPVATIRGGRIVYQR